jgi:glycosyltransferase involved in cell wall biosynthesis
VLERLVVRRADAVVTVSEPLSADLRRRHGIAVETITNGYDPDDAPPEVDGGRDDDTHTILHAGRMASSQRSPAPVLEALRRLDRDDAEVARRIKLALAGPLTPNERELLGAADVLDRVELLGNLPREQVLARQRQADSLLLLTAGNRRGEATGKLYEYLSAGRPILVLGDRTEAARIVADADAGLAVPVDDPERIAAALARLVAGDVGSNGAPDKYGYPAITARLAELVEVARERAAQRKTRA